MARRSRPPSVETFATGDRLRWDVRWVVKKKGNWYIVVREFGSNLPKAVWFHQLVKVRGRHHVTLRCRNSGFPPPEELQPYWYRKKIKKQVRVKGKLKTRVTYKNIYRVPMRKLNREGQWWCPYCMELREFVRPFEVPFIHPRVETLQGRLEPADSGLHCPMCLVNTSDHNVRKYNPMAERFS